MIPFGHLNYEFKARTADLEAAEQRLLALNPRFAGEDHQVDTYFKVAQSRLKLREGNIENALIWYHRPDTAGAKQSDVLLYQHQPDAALKEILTRVNGIDVVVDKRRRIYFIENVKFHFDRVAGLGTFIEVEAIDADGSIGLEKLKMQCGEYARLFGIVQEDYIAVSYSNLLKNTDSR
ncbi:MAG: class IV adenylate cyclase [Ferruginibacter sp.]